MKIIFRPIHSISIIIILTTLTPFTFSQTTSTCHYTCTTCTSPSFHHCLTCPINRGIPSLPSTPFAGMCYCSSSMDESQTGECLDSSSFSYSNKSLTWAFIVMALLLSGFMLCVRGFRYFFVKTIEDVQELSLIIFINMYFPQQYDTFLTQLYRFNISSFLFESMTSGGLFEVGEGGMVVSKDGTNIEGKYNLLYKTANFFSNMFTWTIVVVCIIGVMVVLRLLKNRLIEAENRIEKVGQEKVQKNSNPNLMNTSQASIKNPNDSLIISQPLDNPINDSLSISHSQPNNNHSTTREKYQISKTTRQDPYSYTLTNILIKLNNMLSYNFLIVFLYLSLIEININIFTQMKNLRFVSSFAGVGSILAVVFLVLEIGGLVWLYIKCRHQIMKPQWMQDHSYTSLHHLTRTNFKSLTSYFFFWSSLKKLLLALVIAMFYDTPSNAILGFTIIQLIYLCLSIYLQPFQKRYIRIHFYLCETLKLFFFISLVNFVEKYKEYTKLIELTSIMYGMFVAIFGFHFVTILVTLFIERKVYWYQTKQVYGKCKKMCAKRQDEGQVAESHKEDAVIGYFHYILQKDDQETQSSSSKMPQESLSNQHKDLKDIKQFSLDQEEKLHVEKVQQEEEEQQQNDKWRKYFYVYKDYENEKDQNLQLRN